MAGTIQPTHLPFSPCLVVAPEMQCVTPMGISLERPKQLKKEEKQRRLEVGLGLGVHRNLLFVSHAALTCYSAPEAGHFSCYPGWAPVSATPGGRSEHAPGR